MKLSNKYLIFEIIKNILFILFITFFLMKGMFYYAIKEANDDVSRVSNYFKYMIIDNNDIISNRLHHTIENLITKHKWITYSDALKIRKELSSNIDIIRIYKNNKEYTEFIENDMGTSFNQNFEDIILQNIEKNEEHFYTFDNERGIFYFTCSRLSNDEILLAGYNISKDDYIKYFSEKFSIDITIFYDNIRINTTLTRNHKLQVGTKLNSKIYNLIYNKNMIYDEIVDSFEKKYISKYTPLYNDNDLKIAIFVGKSANTIYGEIYVLIGIIAIALVIVSIIISYLSYYKIKSKYIQSIVDVDKEIQKFMELKSETKNQNHNSFHIDELESLKNSFDDMKDSIEKYENELEFEAHFDSLTKLKNVNSLYDHYSCSTYKSTNSHCNHCLNTENLNLKSIVMLNINNIDSIISNLGAHIGNEVLKQVSALLNYYLDNSGVDLYKYIGNKFILVIPKNADVSPKDILTIFDYPVTIHENILTLNVSIGAYIIEDSHKNILELVKKASIAMNKARKENASSIKFYDKEMEKSIREKFTLENEIKIGLSHNEFKLNYQPKIDCKSEKIIGFEALIRWNHKVKGVIPPNKFIPIAEHSGLIIHLGKWILEESFSFIKRINRKDIHIAINISVVQLIQDDFIEYIESLLKKYELDGSLLHFEITESVFVNSYVVIVQKLNHLRSLGIKIDLDDFGTGYSSLNYLVNLPINSLKIDKSFIDNILSENNFLEEIINIGKKIGLTIIAEGVETKEQINKVNQYNCDIVQGYFYSKPLDEKDLLKFLKDNKGENF